MLTNFSILQEIGGVYCQKPVTLPTRYLLNWFLSEALFKFSPVNYLVRYVTHSSIVSPRGIYHGNRYS